MIKISNSISHPKVFDMNSGETSISTYRKSVQECLKLLLLTSRGELLGDPYYGTNLYISVNEKNDEILKDEIITDFCEAIFRYEKRVIVNSEDIIVTLDEKTVYITINYEIIKLGTDETLELSMLRGDYGVKQ